MSITNIKINTVNGDVVTGTKSVVNSVNSPAEIMIEAITKLIHEIQKSEIEDKNTIIKNIEDKRDDPSKLKSYLESLSNITSISSNISDVLQAIGVIQN